MKPPSDARDQIGPSQNRYLRDGGLKRVDIKGSYDDKGEIVGAVSTLKALIECVLDRYQERAQISDRQHEAGMRLRQMWRAAVLEPSTIGAYGAPAGHGAGGGSTAEARRDLGEALLSARLGKRTPDWQPMIVITRTSEQIFAVKAKLQFTVIGHITVAVCGLDEWAGGTQRLVALREGLGALANHWNLPH